MSIHTLLKHFGGLRENRVQPKLITVELFYLQSRMVMDDKSLPEFEKIEKEILRCKCILLYHVVEVSLSFRKKLPCLCLEVMC